MKRASTPTTHTLPAPGPTDSRYDGARRQSKGIRRRPPRIALVVACSYRKRTPPPVELRLSSLQGLPDERAVEWSRRISETEAARHRAHDLYAGDHWRAACEAYRLARQYSSRAELWVVSAGYGLILSDTLIKSYGATFASGATDSVWRGLAEGDRRECLRNWWQKLDHQCAFADLFHEHEDCALVIAAGAAYIDAFEPELEEALECDSTGDRVSLISGGSRRSDASLPANGALSAAVGGTDTARNARLLAVLAREATEHRFSRARMEEIVMRMALVAPSRPRRAGRSAPDEEIARRVHTLRRRVHGISRTRALRELRKMGIACEQARFARIWARDPEIDSVPAEDAVTGVL
jgi:hypothetical protein